MNWISRFHLIRIVVAIAVLGLGGSLLARTALTPPRVTWQVTNDTDFRRVLRETSAVFTLGPQDHAVDHWMSLWGVSERLDRSTQRDRRCLLVAAVETVLARASTPEQVAARIRDALGEELRTGQLRWDQQRNCLTLPDMLSKTY